MVVQTIDPRGITRCFQLSIWNMTEQKNFLTSSIPSLIVPTLIPHTVLGDGTVNTLGGINVTPNDAPGDYSLVCHDQLDTTSRKEISSHKESCVSTCHGNFDMALGKLNHITPLALELMIQPTTDDMESQPVCSMYK